MLYRPFESERDADAVHRIWRECGWISDDAQHPAMDTFLSTGRRIVADVNGEAECLVCTDTGAMQYLHHDLPFGLVSAVTTSRVARRQGLAGRLTAAAVAHGAELGEIVCGLGMFDQGFYDRLGFGSGPYEHLFEFDPALIQVPSGVRARPPRRLTTADAAAVHASRLARRRRHGACNFPAMELTHAEMRWDKSGFGLGYFDDAGVLTHHLWLEAKDAIHGPYSVRWMSYRTSDELLELMALLSTLSDQVRQVRMDEPPGLQLQDLLRHPMRHRMVTRGADLGQQFRFSAWWQMRINDVPACMARCVFHRATPLRFNLTLVDPITESLPSDMRWRGAGGAYTITVGQESGAEPGHTNGLPAMTASVGAFTRLWLGVGPASVLSITSDLAAPPDLLHDLDDAFRELPTPHPDWDF